MDVEPGSGWADAVSKILKMGKNNPETNKILSKAKKDYEKRNNQESDDQEEGDDSNDDDELEVSSNSKQPKSVTTCITKKLKPDPQRDALLENELKDAATRGVVHLFNAVKTVNPKSDKKKKKKKKKKIKKRRKIR